MWSERPTPAALLAARVERGWLPTPSPLKSGPTVMGYAACLKRGA
ncbi:MAG: hypothetical protein R3A52_24470 [Polyangiales bacterium]